MGAIGLSPNSPQSILTGLKLWSGRYRDAPSHKGASCSEKMLYAFIGLIHQPLPTEK